MTAYSDENIAKARARIPATASKALKNMVARAQERGLTEVAEEGLRELELRGSLDFDGPSAERHATWAAEVADLDLTEAIGAAFRAVPASEDVEQPVIRLIGDTPGISNAELVAARGKGDIGLVVGQFVHRRHGFFRKWLPDQGKSQSDLLLERDKSGRSVQYRFTPEAEAAFRDLGLIG